MIGIKAVLENIEKRQLSWLGYLVMMKDTKLVKRYEQLKILKEEGEVDKKRSGTM